VPGQVKVTGHTDDQPIRSVRFPSNWHLSKERALSVMRILTEKGTLQSRLSAEGRADAEPIALNDTPADRARNRRVEITLSVPRSRN
jgi:type VI secretion system protein ImpK